MKPKIFVTGAAGFVGFHLLPMLTSRGYSVTALVKSQQEKKRVTRTGGIVVADLSKTGKWQDELRGHEIVIHLAAEISAKNPKDFEKNNVIATQNLVSAAKRWRIKKIILFSSAAVTSIRQDPYSLSKKKKEEIVMASKLNYVILRPSMIYGQGDNKNIGWLIKTVKKLPVVPLPGGGNFGRQPVYVDDICKIVIKLIEKDYQKKLYEIHGKEYVSLKKMIEVINKNLKSKKLTFSVPIFLLIGLTGLSQIILPNPKFTVDQIKSLTSGEKFKGDKWWEIFDIIPTTFEQGILGMTKK